MPVMIAIVVAIAMSMSRESQHAANPADDATGHATDHAANRRADRTGRAPANGCAVLATTDNALSVRGERHCKNGSNAGGHDHLNFHEQISIVRWGNRNSSLAPRLRKLSLTPPAAKATERFPTDVTAGGMRRVEPTHRAAVFRTDLGSFHLGFS